VLRKANGAELTKSIEDAETKIPQLESEIKAAGAEAAQLMEDLQSHKQSREEEAKKQYEGLIEAKQKEIEGVVNPIMMKVYQSAGGGDMPDMGGMGGAPPGAGGAGGPTVEEVD
jgi:L1 cell adhesion molecule like protein